MKISYNWLKQFIEIDWTAEKTGELLTDLGLEVEGIEPFESVKGGLQGIVLGEVLSCEKHPNADRLKVCSVDVGTGENLQIVCGAPNVAKGQKVPVALVGTTLYPVNADPWKVKKGKIRGVESHGMICAEDEMGIGEDHEGIMVIDTENQIGTPCSEIFEIEEDQVFEIGLTPNRADAMSHFGVARDLRAGLRQKEINKELITPSVSSFAVDNRSLRIEIQVENPELAPRYCGLTISNLIVEDSPDWLKNRLKAIGLSPINNVVDATNYVMHELGQPLHAFDADRIHGKKVVVKRLPSGSEFMTLDGELRTLHEEDLMICDAEKPMCIAGVFGGINTGVTNQTRSIFLESAYFDPVSIRKTAKRHGLNTDASFRFERGIDINLVEYALTRAAILIRDIAGGDITSDLTDLYPKKFEDSNVFLSIDKIHNLIGDEIPRDTLMSIMASLDIQVKSVTESGFGLLIPPYRVDVTRDVDVIEEILRVYGYNNIPDKQKVMASITPPKGTEPHRIQERVADRLSGQGFFEILGNSLCNPGHNALLNLPDGHEAVALVNPLSQELSELRGDMIFSGLASLSHNLNRKQTDLKLYEFGKVYAIKDGEYLESDRVSMVLCGNKHREAWTGKPEPMGFFYGKAAVVQLLNSVGLENWTEEALDDPRFKEGLRFISDGQVIADYGVVSPQLCTAFDIDQEVLYGDLRWSRLVESARGQEIVFQDIPKYPEVRRDFALLIEDGIPFREILEIARKTERKLLQDVRLFDVYTGDSLPDGKKSYAVSFYLQDPQKTLKDKQIEKTMERLQKAFESELGAELR